MQPYSGAPRLVDMIDPHHELLKLAPLTDRNFFEREWVGFLPSAMGRPATSPRLIAVLIYPQHIFNLSDETVVARWVRNPCYQHRAPMSPPRWCAGARGSASEAGCAIGPGIPPNGVELSLSKMIEAGRNSGASTGNNLKRVAVDTTVMKTTIAHPTDARFCERACALLIDLAEKAGIEMRRSNTRLAPLLGVFAPT